MQFSLKHSTEILARTPYFLAVMLNDLSPEWTTSNEGENTWTARDVLAHLILCEETNWITRIKIILSDQRDKTFTPIDMTAHFELSANCSVSGLIERFCELRESSIRELSNIDPEGDFMKTAIHPTLGIVNLQQLMATWVTHDLSHIAQIARVMAKQNKENVGPFAAFLNVLNN